MTEQLEANAIVKEIIGKPENKGPQPKKSCRKCYGRGYIGKLLDGRLVQCRCMRRKG